MAEDVPANQEYDPPRRSYSAPLKSDIPPPPPSVTEMKLKEQEQEILAIKSKLDRMENKQREKERQRVQARQQTAESATQTLPVPKAAQHAQPHTNTGAEPINWIRSIVQTFHCTALPHKRKTCPLPVESCSLTSGDHGVLLHGGTNGTHITNETWLFDGAIEQWRKIKGVGDVPLGRYGHTAVTYKRRMIVFGGFGLSDVPTNVQGNITAPPPPDPNDTFQAVGISSAMTGFTSQWIDAETGYAPAACGLLSSIFSFDFDTHQWQEMPNGPEPVFVKNHTAVVSKNLMYVFGGCTTHGRTNAVKVYDMDTSRWTADEYYNPQLFQQVTNNIQLSKDLPDPRSGHTAVMYKHQGRPCMIVFGGRLSKFSYCNNVYVYKFDTRTWLYVPCQGTAPHPRAGHTSVMYKQHMITFGGYCNQSRDKKIYFNDIQMLNMVTLEWHKVGVSGQFIPRNRCHHASSLYEAAGRHVKMLVFGGWGEASVAMNTMGGMQLQTITPQVAAAVTQNQVYSPNNDTFTFTVAIPFVKPKPPTTPQRAGSKGEVGPRREVLTAPAAPYKRMSSTTQERGGQAASGEAVKRSTKDKGGNPPPWVKAATKFEIPPIPPPKRPLRGTKLPNKQLDEAFLRLSNIERLARSREKLENKFLVEKERWQMTYEEQNDFVDRMYYTPMEAKEVREKELQDKFFKRDERRILDEDEVYDLVDRLTQPKPPKEDIVEKPNTITHASTEALVHRMYTKAIEHQQMNKDKLVKKYYDDNTTPSKKKTPGELETLVNKLYNEAPRAAAHSTPPVK